MTPYKLKIKTLDDGAEYDYIDKDKVVASASMYDYRGKDFDWVLIADVFTDPEYRKNGLASSLIDKIYNHYCVGKPIGAYLLVKVDNYPAIQMYKKLGFRMVKTYKLEGKMYYIYAKGSADTEQLKKVEFGG